MAEGRLPADRGVPGRRRLLEQREDGDQDGRGLSSTGTGATLGGVAVEERDFVSAVYGNFPYVLAFVVMLTLILLARAFRSVVLALKAAILNLVSLGGRLRDHRLHLPEGPRLETIWSIHATQSIIPWIPLMIFAFLFGLSMDYEVFMLTRMREIYDETGDTEHRDRARARPHRQARDERGARAHVRVLHAVV